ncbi:MAG: DUF2238 domain-containing protein [Holophaga sp.]|nr:DUF2238 domain-containing protein [Holophaga sp.]
MLTHATSSTFVPFGRNRLLQSLAGGYLLVWLWSAWHPLYPHDWMMENLLVVVFVPVLIATYRRFPLSDLSYLCITLFMALHAIGAHYTYSNVPFGFALKDAFHLARNPFDRIVHFSFGLLLAYPARELFMRVAQTRGIWNFLLPVEIVLSLSGLFEIFESWAARLSAAELGNAYLGTQGDIWDAQKDMTVATLGAILTMVITAMVLARKAGKKSTA